MKRPRKSRRMPLAAALCLAVVCRAAAEQPPPLEAGKQAPQGLEELFGDITRNMDLIEQMLNRKDSGESCQGSQKELVGKIDKLIEELKKRQQSMSGGGGGGDSSSQPKGGKGSKDQQAEKKQRELEKMQGRTPKDQSAQKQGGKKTEPGKEQGKGEPQKSGEQKSGEPKDGKEKVPNDEVDAKKALPPGEAGPLAEKRGAGGWGFLPGEVRALIEASGRPGVPAKYEEIIKRYFQRLSEGDKTK
jgi:hypothetical protein